MFCSRSGRNGLECESDAVDAIAQAGRFGAVIEDVTQMAAAAAAVNGGSHHAEARVPGCPDGSLDRRPEAWPAGSTVEFRGRGEQVEVTARASKVASPLLVQQRAGEGTLGRALAQHGKLVGRQELAPLGVGMRDLEGLTPRRRDPPWRNRCRSKADGRVDQKTTSRHHGLVLPISCPESSAVIATTILADTLYCDGNNESHTLLMP